MSKLPSERPVSDIQLILGDCLKVLPTLADASVDCAITDPPYNVGIEYGIDTNDRRADYQSWCAEWFAHLKRICRGPTLALQRRKERNGCQKLESLPEVRRQWRRVTRRG